MHRALLPTLFIAFLLVMGAEAWNGEIDDEKIEAMLQNILNNIDLPVPSNFQGDSEFRSEPYIHDYGGSFFDEYEATLSIFKQVEDAVKVNGTYQYFDEIYQTYYTYWHEIEARIKIYIDNLDPSRGCRYTFEYDVNELKNKYDVYEESNDRLIAYSIEIGDWEGTLFRYIERDYEIYCLEYFSMEDYEVYVKVQIKIDVDVNSIRKETEYEKDIVYEINPESLIINELESIKLYSSFTDGLTNNLKTALQQLIKEKTGEENRDEEGREEQQYKIGNITIYFEYNFNLIEGEEMVVYYGENNIKPSPYYNVTVEHVATGYKEYFDEFDFLDGKIRMDKVFNVSLVNSTGDGNFKIWIDVFTDDTSYINRVKDDSLLPQKAFIECDVSINGRNITHLTIKKARHCWIKVDNEWEVLWSKKGYKQKDGTNGFEIKLRSVLAWEKRIKYYIYKFLQESNFYSNVKDAYKFDLAMIDSIPIYYERGVTPGYDPSLNIINMSNPAGNIYTYDSDEFDSIFHEFAHALKEHAYHFADEDVDDYLGGAHGGTCSETNIYFAFEEGHSEFFASLMVDYVKEKELIEEQFLAPTDYYDTSCHFAKEGDKIEGAVAGLLLNGLYLEYVKEKYDNPQTKTYEIFARACELCHKYLKHYPYSIHDLLPFIVAIEPECRDELSDVDLLWNGGYGCRVWIHGNLYIDEVEGLYGYPLLIAVEPSWMTKVKAGVNNTPYTVEEPYYGAWDVSDGMACCIFIEKNTRIEADFSQGDGIYMILFDLNGNPMEEILAMQYGWFGDAVIEIEKDGIKVVQGRVVVKSNTGTTYKAGDKIKITPHSEFILSVENETALLYVMNGSVGVDNGISYEEVEKNKKAVVTEESIDVSSYKDKELDDIWNNFGEAMETLGIEKEEENGGKQPGFELVVIIVSLVTIIWFRRKYS